MNGAQIAMVIIFGMNVGIYLSKDGQPKTGTYKLWSGLLSIAIHWFILYKGGFWN